MSSLKGIDPHLKRYLRHHHVPDVFESIITGLAMNCPDDSLRFIADKLRLLMETNFEGMQWDMFVDTALKPSRRVVTESYLEQLFNHDENVQPTPEMYHKAYDFYNDKKRKMCFYAWLQYHMMKKRRRLEMMRRLEEARQYYRHRVMNVHFTKWLDWTRFVNRRNAEGFMKIKFVYHTSLCRLIFKSWFSVMKDALRTREYFERLERGEIVEGDNPLAARVGGETRDEISLLPRKAALKVFAYIDIADLLRCARVCRSWKVLTQSPALWTKVNLSTVKNKVTDPVVIQMLHKCRPYLVHLNLRGCMGVRRASFNVISQCKNLQDLNLSECKGLSDDSLRQIAEGCRALLYLNVSYTDISDGAMRALARSCLNMQYLSLAYCQKFTDKGLHYLTTGKGCRKLIHLDLSGCTQLTSVGFHHVSVGCPTVQSLVLNDLPMLSDDHILEMTDRCQSIRALCLLGSPNLSDTAFKALAQHRRLQKLRVEGNSRITDGVVKTLVKLCHQMNHVYLADCPRLTDISLKNLAMLKNISVLNVADCIRLSDSGVRQVVEGPSGARIREMNLTNCVRVSDVSLLRIAQKCQNLTFLSVCYCEHITDAGIELLGNMPNLTSVDLSGTHIGDTGLAALGSSGRVRDVTASECEGVTDLGLQKFCAQVRELEMLDISHCQAITDTGIKSMAFCCRMLTHLNFCGCPQLTDLSMQYVSGVCRYLHVLDISGCWQVSDKSLKYLRKGCKQLKMLTMLYCKNITKPAVNKIRGKVEQVEYSTDEVPAYFNYSKK
ncbi:FBXL13 [Branchiostoma lanceolatum]|uniref:FBXL13 protein n=1 Tax=Branchiostoma lanceolatum TaxID=7740 RepID=A0A8J9Z4K9_BRALA|nr:FBXL13 [Branchiostoma lanceolatum]